MNYKINFALYKWLQHNTWKYDLKGVDILMLYFMLTLNPYVLRLCFLRSQVKWIRCSKMSVVRGKWHVRYAAKVRAGSQLNVKFLKAPLEHAKEIWKAVSNAHMLPEMKPMVFHMCMLFSRDWSGLTMKIHYLMIQSTALHL